MAPVPVSFSSSNQFRMILISGVAAESEADSPVDSPSPRNPVTEAQGPGCSLCSFAECFCDH